MQNSPNRQPEDAPAQGHYPSRRRALQQQVGAVGRLALLVCLVTAVWLAVDAGSKVMTANAQKEQNDADTVRSMGLVDPTHKGLSSRFTDSSGRLLADPPASADQLIDPPTIVVAHLESTDSENPTIPWKELEASIAKVTDRKVTDLVYDNGPDQLALIDKGQITLVALHAADTPFLVNNYGYQPAAVLGTDNGANGNHLDIIVPSSSSIAQAADLRGHSLVCTVPSSITGYRAAVALLLGDLGLRPNVDYSIIWSLKQKASIQGVADKQYEAAAISDDKLQTLLTKGDVSQTAYKIIYKSGVLPRTTIGWFYNLKPELAEKIRTAILQFRPASEPGVDNEEDADSTPLHFIPIDYKADFQLVREIDDRFDPRLDAKTKHVAEAAVTTEPSAQ